MSGPLVPPSKRAFRLLFKAAVALFALAALACLGVVGYAFYWLTQNVRVVQTLQPDEPAPAPARMREPIASRPRPHTDDRTGATLRDAMGRNSAGDSDGILSAGSGPTASHGHADQHRASASSTRSNLSNIAVGHVRVSVSTSWPWSPLQPWKTTVTTSSSAPTRAAAPWPLKIPWSASSQNCSAAASSPVRPRSTPCRPRRKHSAVRKEPILRGTLRGTPP